MHWNKVDDKGISSPGANLKEYGNTIKFDGKDMVKKGIKGKNNNHHGGSKCLPCKSMTRHLE